MVIKRLEDTIVVSHDDIDKIIVMIYQGITKNVNGKIVDAIQNEITTTGSTDKVLNVFFNRKNLGIFVIDKHETGALKVETAFADTYCMGYYHTTAGHLIMGQHPLSKVAITKNNEQILVYQDSSLIFKIGDCEELK